MFFRQKRSGDHVYPAIPGTGIAGNQGRCILGKYHCLWPTEVPKCPGIRRARRADENFLGCDAETGR